MHTKSLSPLYTHKYTYVERYVTCMSPNVEHAEEQRCMLHKAPSSFLHNRGAPRLRPGDHAYVAGRIMYLEARGMLVLILSLLWGWRSRSNFLASTVVTTLKLGL